MQNTDPWAKAGVMIRASLNADAADAYMYLSSGNGLNFIARTATGASSGNTHGPATTTVPYWVKLVRSGTSFTGYASSDGQNWGSPIGSATISMASAVYVGLAVTSHTPAVVGTATFDNVTLQASNGATAVDDPAVSYTGSWNSSSSVSGYYNATAHWSGNSGDTASYTFTGTGIAWVGGTNNAHGQADIAIDGTLVRSHVDTYSTAKTPQQVLYSVSGLSTGQHTITISVDGAQDPGSSGATIDVDALIVTP